jgi:hypothetical protein
MKDRFAVPNVVRSYALWLSCALAFALALLVAVALAASPAQAAKPTPPSDPCLAAGPLPNGQHPTPLNDQTIHTDGLYAAELFDKALTANHEKPWLAGGSALTLQGGARPQGDFDFRVKRTTKLSDFGGSFGKELIQKINSVGEQLTAKLKNVAPAAQHVPDPRFVPISVVGDPNVPGFANKTHLTVGTMCWFGVEVSVSVVNKPYYPDELTPVTPTLESVTVTNLLRDKIYSAINRNKPGELGIEKVGKDIFDAFNAAKISNFTFTYKSLLDAMEKRASLYYGSLNPESVYIPTSVARDTVAARMVDRFVRIAHSYLSVPARKKVLEGLSKEYKFNALPEARAVANIVVPPYDTSLFGKDLDAWFTEWNTGPRFRIPLSRDEKLAKQDTAVKTGLIHADLEPLLIDSLPDSVISSSSPVVLADPVLLRAAINENLSQAFEKVDLPVSNPNPPPGSSNPQIKLNTSAKQILFILGLKNGQRKIKDPKKPANTYHAFALPPDQYKLGVTQLKSLKLVDVNSGTVKLTKDGKSAYSSVDWTSEFTAPKKIIAGQAKLGFLNNKKIVSNRGCLKNSFMVAVEGRQIKQVTFLVNDKKLKVVKVTPNAKKQSVSLSINPGAKPLSLVKGTYTIKARVEFTSSAKTKSKTSTLRLRWKC